MLFNGMNVYSNANCLQTWQLNDFTKELMGAEWVKKFNAWAEYVLPKQPACYIMENRIIAHPSIVDELNRLFNSRLLG